MDRRSFISAISLSTVVDARAIAAISVAPSRPMAIESQAAVVESVSAESDAAAVVQFHDGFRRRLGRFRISDQILRHGNPADLLAVMATCVVIRTEHLFWSDVTEYTAWSPNFDIAESDGCEYPRYEAMISLHADGTKSFSWKKLDQGRVTA